jgi:Rab GDP dissociation inhibitor
MGMFKKRRARKFSIFVQNYKEAAAKMHDGMDLRRATTKELFEKKFAL